LAPRPVPVPPGTVVLWQPAEAAGTIVVQAKTMTAVLILAFSVIALAQFAISQWRMIWLTTANQPLSDSLCAVTGIEAESIGPNDFGTLLGLCDELSPQIKQATPWLRQVRGYYKIVANLEKACRSIQPALSSWAATEMKTCSRYVAVVLDQNLSIALDRPAAFRSL
jgi:hypothetical protein